MKKPQRRPISWVPLGSRDEKSERGEHRGFNPLDQKGMAPEEPLRNWSNQTSPRTATVRSTYTPTRVILMNGIEVRSIIFGQRFARITDDLELKQQLALFRRVAQERLTVVNGLNAEDQTPLETSATLPVDGEGSVWESEGQRPRSR